jgi:hypothetical protein
VASEAVDEQLRSLDFKLGQLRREYEQYFLGTRPREPILLRGEVQKLVITLTNQPFQNTALKFRFASLCSRFQAFRRQWDETLRKIEAGTYERHSFKARIRHRAAPPTPPGGAKAPAGDELYRSLVDARMACGQEVESLSPEKLDQVISRQRKQLRERFGSDANFRFRVAVENGRAKIKATRVDA